MDDEPIYTTATVTKTGPKGQSLADGKWRAILIDGTRISVALTAKIHTAKQPILKVGQVIHVGRHPASPVPTWKANPSDFEFVSRSKLHEE